MLSKSVLSDKTPFNWPAKFEPVTLDGQEKETVLYPIYKELIELLSQHHLMTSRQIRYRMFSPNSNTYLKNLLQLARAGYIKFYNFKPYNRKHLYRVFGIGPRTVRELKYALPPTFKPMLATKILAANQLYLRLWDLPGRPYFELETEGVTTGHFLFRQSRFAFVVLRDHENIQNEVRTLITKWPLSERNLIVVAENEPHVLTLARLFKDWIIPVRYTTDSALHRLPLAQAFARVHAGRICYTQAQVFEF